MDKKSKEALRRYKKSRQQAQSSSDSSSSDSDSGSSGSSYSSSDSERNKAAERHRKKKAARQAAAGGRRSISSSGDERRKREKREHCQKKLEAKRNHIKRKLKEAKLKKRAAAAAAALSGHSHRALSPGTQAKLKKLAERKHLRAASKERRDREREKHRAAAREREHRRVGSRSPTKITKIRIHQDVKRQKTPPRVHHQLMSREKIIIQTRTHRTPSPSAASAERERQRHELKLRHEELTRERERRDRDRERAEREAARDKERAEALARCQERQRERERIAREKMRREEEEKKYGGGGGSVGERGERLLPRPAEREIAIAAARGNYNSRERSLEAVSVDRNRHLSKRDLDVYEREREFIDAERHGLLDRDDIRREREYMAAHRRNLSPVAEHFGARMPRDLYPPEEERERAFNRGYLDETRTHPRERDAWLDSRELRERELHDLRDTRDARDFRELDHELIYPDERERLVRERERTLAGRGDWKNDWEPREREWNDSAPSARGGFVGGPKRGGSVGVGGGLAGAGNVGVPPKLPPLPREQRGSSEPDWDADEIPDSGGSTSTGKKADIGNTRDGPSFSGSVSSSSQRDSWVEHDQRDLAPLARISNIGPGHLHHHRSERGGRGFRRRGAGGEHGERNFRSHPPPLMTLPVNTPGSSFHGANPRFPNARNMTYTNPNLIKKQQAALMAAKAAAQASAVAAATTAVAAAKAAAQSAANATTNPGILGHVSGGTRQQQGYSDDKPEAGEILADNENDDRPPADKSSIVTCDEKVSGELSEISDSDDDILNKTDKKSKPESEISAFEPTIKSTDVCVSTPSTTAEDDNKPDDEEMLDFEEISDGELEEDARNKGVGDALGVDWASLIAETKRQAENAAPNVTEQPTTAKQKWQPHRIILDIGISMRMAGEEYAKRLLNEAKKKLDEELLDQQVLRIKTEIKDETSSDDNSQSAAIVMETDADAENTNDIDEDNKIKCKTEVKMAPALDELNADGTGINVERLHPIACIQVAERMRALQRHKLIANACGPNSRALSARQDLKLRRQLCGLPARECNFPRPIPAASAKLKAMALAAFQRTLEVK